MWKICCGGPENIFVLSIYLFSSFIADKQINKQSASAAAPHTRRIPQIEVVGDGNDQDSVTSFCVVLSAAAALVCPGGIFAML